LLAALRLVLSGSRVSVREAIGSYGLGGGGFGGGLVDRVLGSVHWLPRPALISLRNTFRRKGRLALTLTTLAFGGGLFVGVLSVRGSLLATVDEIYGFSNYDLQVSFVRPYPLDQIERQALPVAGVVRLE